MIDLASLADSISSPSLSRSSGRIIAAKGPVLLAKIPGAALGDYCLINLRNGDRLPAQVVAFENELVSISAFGNLDGVYPGAVIESTGQSPMIRVSNSLPGHVLDALGNPLDGKLDDSLAGTAPLMAPPPDVLSRAPANVTFETGVKSIDALCTLARGQRVGLFSSAGGGKSTLLGMIARNSSADINVIALVGERGREVKDFLQESLGTKGMEKSVVVAATSDESPLRRYAAVLTATSISEYFRAQGKSVLLLVDSLTRAARAIREVSLAAGEIPVRQGYTTSVYTQLPRIIERAGTASRGSITAIYTILTNGEGESDPLAEEAKSLLDGHLVLSSAVARQGIRPALDVPSSISRLMTKLHEPEYVQATDKIRIMQARLRKDKDILLFGGTPDPELQSALELEPALREALNQGIFESSDFAGIKETVRCIANEFSLRAKTKDRANQGHKSPVSPVGAAAFPKSRNRHLLSQVRC